MVSLLRQVRFQVHRVYTVNPDTPDPGTGVILTVTGNRAYCPCPEFELEGDYIVFAYYQDSWSRYALSRYSTVKPYSAVNEFMIQYFLGQCHMVEESIIN